MAAGCAEQPKTPPDPQTEMSALADRIAVLVDEERHKLDPNAKTLVADPELAKVALARARDMAARNYLAHEAPNGDTSASLLMADDAQWQGLLGENLAAQHYRKESGVDVETFAQAFLDEWVKSAPHRENLAYPPYDRTGVGAAVNGDTVYVAELFAAEADAPPPGTKSAVTAYPSPDAAAKESKPDPVRLRGDER